MFAVIQHAPSQAVLTLLLVYFLSFCPPLLHLRCSGMCGPPGIAAVRNRGRGCQLTGSGYPDCCSRLRRGRGLQRIAGSSLAATCSPLILQKTGDWNVASGTSRNDTRKCKYLLSVTMTTMKTGSVLEYPEGTKQMEALYRITLESRRTQNLWSPCFLDNQKTVLSENLQMLTESLCFTEACFLCAPKYP